MRDSVKVIDDERNIEKPQPFAWKRWNQPNYVESDDLYEAIVNGKDKTITDEQTLLQMEILETGVKSLK